MKNFCTGFSSFYQKNEAEFLETFEKLESGIKKVFIENRGHFNYIYRNNDNKYIEELKGYITLEKSDLKHVDFYSEFKDKKYDMSKNYVNSCEKFYDKEKFDLKSHFDSDQVPVFYPKTIAGTESSSNLTKVGLKLQHEDLKENIQISKNFISKYDNLDSAGVNYSHLEQNDRVITNNTKSSLESNISHITQKKLDEIENL